MKATKDDRVSQVFVNIHTITSDQVLCLLTHVLDHPDPFLSFYECTMNVYAGRMQFDMMISRSDKHLS